LFFVEIYISERGESFSSVREHVEREKTGKKMPTTTKKP